MRVGGHCGTVDADGSNQMLWMGCTEDKQREQRTGHACPCLRSWLGKLGLMKSILVDRPNMMRPSLHVSSSAHASHMPRMRFCHCGASVVSQEDVALAAELRPLLLTSLPTMSAFPCRSCPLPMCMQPGSTRAPSPAWRRVVTTGLTTTPPWPFRCSGELAHTNT